MYTIKQDGWEFIDGFRTLLYHRSILLLNSELLHETQFGKSINLSEAVCL